MGGSDALPLYRHRIEQAELYADELRLGLQLVRRRTREEVKALMAPPESAEQALERVRHQARRALLGHLDTLRNSCLPGSRVEIKERRGDAYTLHQTVSRRGMSWRVRRLRQTLMSAVRYAAGGRRCWRRRPADGPLGAVAALPQLGHAHCHTCAV